MLGYIRHFIYVSSRLSSYLQKTEAPKHSQFTAPFLYGEGKTRREETPSSSSSGDYPSLGDFSPLALLTFRRRTEACLSKRLEDLNFST